MVVCLYRGGDSQGWNGEAHIPIVKYVDANRDTRNTRAVLAQETMCMPGEEFMSVCEVADLSPDTMDILSPGGSTTREVCPISAMIAGSSGGGGM
ncbi:hypothetical protein PM082_010974 [Marasmius tenuissimus]|nr:hypothetical protein PM082_010974 [Marasmius tenuissimus]